ncbi:MAG: hypothetical protein IJ695_00825 [Butyrivibrio sp.]|nr:hypothetical protein [Butyrivibrio sp.]
MKKSIYKKIIASVLIVSLAAASLSGCGKGDAGEDGDYGEYDEYGEEYSEEASGAGGDEAFNPSSVTNDIPEYDDAGVIPKVINAANYVDSEAWNHVAENGGEEYYTWLADYCVNVAGPQAVGMLLRIPCFKEAAEQGLISKYMVLCLDYDEGNQYGAMTQSTYLEKGGNVTRGEGAPVYNLAYRLLVNTQQESKETRDDPKKRRELQDTMIHEMMHAFMDDYTRNAMVGMDKDGNRPMDAEEIFTEALPGWFCEGTAITVEAGYNQSRWAILDNFLLGQDEPQEDILEVFKDTQTMSQAQQIMFESLTGEELKAYKEELGGNDALPTDLTIEENTYGISYVGTMFLYYMAAKTLGLKPMEEDGTLNMDVMLKGLDYILRSLHDGFSLDQVIAEISADPDTGESVYADTTAYEKNFMHGADEPGMVFAQKMLYRLESQITDRNVFTPSGSVLPGYRTMNRDFMDEKYHEAPSVFALVPSPGTTSSEEYFAVSTIRPSVTALGGTRSISYAGEDDLSEAEAEEKDTVYAGDEVCLIEFNQGQEYKSMDEWIRLSEEQLDSIVGEEALTISDAAAADYVGGFILDTGDGSAYFVLMYEDEAHGEFIVAAIGDETIVSRYSESGDIKEDGMQGMRLTLTNGRKIGYYTSADGKNYGEINGTMYEAEELSESAAREALDLLREE